MKNQRSIQNIRYLLRLLLIIN